MPAPKGNQYAVGNQGGRPPKYDLEQEAQDLLDWSKLDNSICLHGFVDDKEYVPEQLCQFAKQSEVFSLALKKAKSRICKRREEMCNDGLMNYGVWAKSANLYNVLGHEYEDSLEERKQQRALDRIDYEIKKKNEIQSTVSEDISSQFSDLMNQISSIQKKNQSSLSIECNNAIKDQ